MLYGVHVCIHLLTFWFSRILVLTECGSGSSQFSMFVFFVSWFLPYELQWNLMSLFVWLIYIHFTSRIEHIKSCVDQELCNSRVAELRVVASIRYFQLNILIDHASNHASVGCTGHMFCCLLMCVLYWGSVDFRLARRKYPHCMQDQADFGPGTRIFCARNVFHCTELTVCGCADLWEVVFFFWLWLCRVHGYEWELGTVCALQIYCSDLLYRRSARASWTTIISFEGNMSNSFMADWNAYSQISSLFRY